jgi:hypothetical protein
MTHTTKTQLAKEKKYYDESFENGPRYFCGGASWAAQTTMIIDGTMIIGLDVYKTDIENTDKEMTHTTKTQLAKEKKYYDVLICHHVSKIVGFFAKRILSVTDRESEITRLLFICNSVDEKKRQEADKKVVLTFQRLTDFSLRAFHPITNRG